MYGMMARELNRDIDIENKGYRKDKLRKMFVLLFIANYTFCDHFAPFLLFLCPYYLF